MLLVSFRGHEFLFSENKLEYGGLLDLPISYLWGQGPYASLRTNGLIYRYGDEIGTVSELSILGKIVPPPNMDRVCRKSIGEYHHATA